MNLDDYFETWFRSGLKWHSPSGTVRHQMTHNMRIVVFGCGAKKRKSEMIKPLRRLCLRRNVVSVSALCVAEAPLIYAVDDLPELTELYVTLLKATGYGVRAFNDRAKAMSALESDRTKPDLLITDYCGLSMPVDGFMHRCRVVHPTLRILMASGVGQTEVRFSQAKPDRFIQKPFTPEEFRQEVVATLAAY